jgi:acyl-CoA thioester hydrolase
MRACRLRTQVRFRHQAVNSGRLRMVRGPMTEDRRTFTTRLRVRTYELDINGHVNNAVYLNWAEQIATEHVEAAGFGQTWMQPHNAAWVVRRHEITYRRPAIYGDELLLTTHAESIRGARGIRKTTITRVADSEIIADLHTEWVWVRLSDGRPTRVPDELVQFFNADDLASEDAANRA